MATSLPYPIVTEGIRKCGDYARAAMRPSRPIPRVGLSATVRHLAVDVAAVVFEVTEDGRRVTVQTEDDETIEFVLNRSTAYYEAPNCGPRLELGG